MTFTRRSGQFFSMLYTRPAAQRITQKAMKMHSFSTACRFLLLQVSTYPSDGQTTPRPQLELLTPCEAALKEYVETLAIPRMRQLMQETIYKEDVEEGISPRSCRPRYRPRGGERNMRP